MFVPRVDSQRQCADAPRPVLYQSSIQVFHFQYFTEAPTSTRRMVDFATELLPPPLCFQQCKTLFISLILWWTYALAICARQE
jgi:hypothetical protein